MINELLWIIGSTLLVSILSLVGISAFLISNKLLNKILLILVGFSAGALMGGAFLHLLPESLETANPMIVGLSIIAGFSAFFVIERVLHWHHCHKQKCEVHTLSYMNLIGDAIHNFIDGIIIAVSYIANIHVGIVTTIAIIAHEVPQEIGDFGVLIYGGFKKSKAILFNFLSALTAVFGAIVGYLLSNTIKGIIPFILPIAAGGFIYIAASDLVPELHKEPVLKRALLSFGFFIVGVLFMLGVKLIFEH